MTLKTFEEFITERDRSNAGITYEKEVRKVLRLATQGRPTQLLRAKGGGSFSAHDVDMAIRLNKKEYPIEIKANGRAQMGGISIAYDRKTKTITLPNSESLNMDDETLELIQETIEDKISDLNKVLDWFKKNDPVYQYNTNPGFPLRVGQDAWKKAVDEGIIKNLNVAIKNNTSFINSYYATKKVYYMQIGKMGLFHLAKNPLKLDVPKLEGEINLEFRAGKSGVKVNKTHDYEYATVILRLQGRLSFKGKSNYTLDTQEGAKKFLDVIENV